MKFKWTNGVHKYNSSRNDRSKRQKSKIIKGIRNIAKPEDFLKIQKSLCQK